MYHLIPESPPRRRQTSPIPVAPLAHPDFRHPEPDDVDTAFLTHLDTQEINGRFNPGASARPTHFSSAKPDNWIHSAHTFHRRRVLEILPKAQSVTPSRVTRYDECGSRAWVYYHTEGHPFRIHTATCRDRWCPSCQAKRAHILRSNLADKVGHRTVRFVTLTLRATGTSLSTRVDQLYAGTSALRRLPFWKRHVTGGAMFVELKWIPETRNWHVHAHLLVEGRYMPNHALRACWRVVTNGSTIVDVRMPKSQRQLESYVTKYVTKAVPQNVIDSDNLFLEAINALFRRRLCTTFGGWRGWRLLDTFQAGNCTAVMPLSQLIFLSRTGGEWAYRILVDIDANLPSTWELVAWAQTLAAELYPSDHPPPLSDTSAN